MDIALQYFTGCPNWQNTRADLSRVTAELGIDAHIELVRIETQEAAEEHGFRGSPTVLVDGVDPFADPDAPVGFACRIYLTESGPAGTPSLAQLKGALGS